MKKSNKTEKYEKDYSNFDWKGALGFAVGAIPAGIATCGATLPLCLGAALISGLTSRAVFFPKKPSVFASMFGFFGRSSDKSQRCDDPGSGKYDAPSVISRSR